MWYYRDLRNFTFVTATSILLNQMHDLIRQVHFRALMLASISLSYPPELHPATVHRRFKYACSKQEAT